jgi:hypothetical protein
MFDEEAEVHNTKLFVGRTEDKQWQLTVYSNTVEAKVGGKSNAMVLPFPVPKGTTTDGINEPHKVAPNADIIRVLDFQNFTQFFAECKACFSIDEDWGDDEDEDLCDKSEEEELEVVQIGGYNVSIARTLDFIKRIDKKIFSVHENLFHVLQKNYESGYGFLICSFDASKKISTEETPPLAYVHRAGDRFFVPTRHEHGHDTGVPHWDHEIFLWNAKYNDNDDTTEDVGRLSSRLNDMLPSPLEKLKSFHKCSIVGTRKNEDLPVIQI